MVGMADTYVGYPDESSDTGFGKVVKIHPDSLEFHEGLGFVQVEIAADGSVSSVKKNRSSKTEGQTSEEDTD